jgi:hypothetical protein
MLVDAEALCFNRTWSDRDNETCRGDTSHPDLPFNAVYATVQLV